MEKRLAKLVAELDKLAMNPSVYISSAEENLFDRGIKAPAYDSGVDEQLAYAEELRDEIRACYQV